MYSNGYKLINFPKTMTAIELAIILIIFQFQVGWMNGYLWRKVPYGTFCANVHLQEHINL